MIVEGKVCYYPEDLNDDSNKENCVPSSFGVPLI